MSTHAMPSPVDNAAKPMPVRWAIVAGAGIGFVILFAMRAAENREPLDTSAIVPVEQVEAMGRRYKQVSFSLLASFDYGVRPDDDSGAAGNEVIPEEVLALDGQRVGIVGFMLPVDFNGQGVNQFILNANMDMCYFGAPTLPNQFITVTITGGRRGPLVHTPVVVFGTLHITPQRRNGRVVGLYRVDADGIGTGAAS